MGDIVSDIAADVAKDVAAASVGNKLMVGGGLTGFAGVVAQINWVGLVGTLVAVLGLVVSAYFQIRKDRRERQESEAREARNREIHEARMAAIRDRCEAWQE